MLLMLLLAWRVRKRVKQLRGKSAALLLLLLLSLLLLWLPSCGHASLPLLGLQRP